MGNMLERVNSIGKGRLVNIATKFLAKPAIIYELNGREP